LSAAGSPAAVEGVSFEALLAAGLVLYNRMWYFVWMEVEGLMDTRRTGFT